MAGLIVGVHEIIDLLMEKLLHKAISHRFLGFAFMVVGPRSIIKCLFCHYGYVAIIGGLVCEVIVVSSHMWLYHSMSDEPPNLHDLLLHVFCATKIITLSSAYNVSISPLFTFSHRDRIEGPTSPQLGLAAPRGAYNRRHACAGEPCRSVARPLPAPVKRSSWRICRSLYRLRGRRRSLLRRTLRLRR